MANFTYFVKIVAISLNRYLQDIAAFTSEGTMLDHNLSMHMGFLFALVMSSTMRNGGGPTLEDVVRTLLTRHRRAQVDSDSGSVLQVLASAHGASFHTALDHRINWDLQLSHRWIEKIVLLTQCSIPKQAPKELQLLVQAFFRP